MTKEGLLVVLAIIIGILFIKEFAVNFEDIEDNSRSLVETVIKALIFYTVLSSALQ